MTDRERLTTAHPRWDEFVDRLDRALAVNKGSAECLEEVERSEGRQLTDDERTATMLVMLPRGCNGSTDVGNAHEASRAILSAMGFAIEPSIAFLRMHGGYCDCEVLLNVAGREEACGGPPTGCFACQHRKIGAETRDIVERFSEGERAYLNELA